MIQFPEGTSRKDLEAMIDLFNSWGRKHQTEGMIDAISHFLNVSGLRQRLMDAEAKLAELEKQEPAGKWIVQYSITEDGYDRHSFASWRGNQPKNNTELFTRPAPAINLAELVPDEMTSEMAERLFFGKAITAVDVWNAACAAMLRNIEEQSK